MKHKGWWPEASGNKMARKPIIVGVSLILVVGVVIGTILVNRNSHSSDDEGLSTIISHSSDDKGLSTKIKSVDTICGSCTYKDKCMSTIAPIATNASAGPKDFLRAVLVAAFEEMKGGLEKSHSIKIDNLERIDKLALEECTRFMQYSVEDLEVALTKLEENELNTVNDQVHEFLNALSAVTAYQITCCDQLEDPNLKAEMENALLNATLVTTNAADVFAELSNILVAFNISLNVNPSHRKLLLDVGSVDEQGYPHWLSEGDRRLLAGNARPTDVTVTVARDGSGNFTEIAKALSEYPKKLPPQSRYVIHVKAGTYKEENLTVTSKQVNVFLYGDGKGKTIITGDKSYGKKYPMSSTGSITVKGNNFLAKSIGFVNTAGPEEHQAVALTVESHHSAFFDCSMDGYQDTLYAHTNFQFYRDCVISGTLDFVFGTSSAVIQNSQIIVKQPGVNQTWTVIAADGRNSSMKAGGLVFQNCTIIPRKDFNAAKTTAYLARPWAEYSRAIFMDSFMDSFINSTGFQTWNQSHPNNIHCLFAEYRNRGPGSITNGRVKWPSCYNVFTEPEAVKNYTAGVFIDGNTWLRETGFPFNLGL